MQLSWQGQNLVIKSQTFSVVFATDTLKINDYVITDPGEYEVCGVSVKHVDGRYLFHIENLPLAFVPSLTNGNSISSEEIDELSSTDVLIMQLNDIDEKTQKQMSELVSKIDPKCLIVVCHSDTCSQIIAKEYNIEPVSDFKLTGSDLPEEGRNTILMKCSKSDS